MIEGCHIFDCEVGAKDWLFVFKELETGEYTVIHNDNEAIMKFMERDPLLGGFNNKHYDNHILKAILGDYDPESVKQINDLIILDEVNGWEIPELREIRAYFSSFDLMDDCQLGTSLKSFEAHLGIPIEETEVDFNLDREWTQEELERMIRYCKYDVDATERLFYIRQGYLRTLVRIRNAVKGGIGLGTVANQIKKMADNANRVDTDKLERLARACEALRGIRGPSNLARGFERMADATARIDVERLERMRDALQGMNGIRLPRFPTTGGNGATPTSKRSPTRIWTIRPRTQVPTTTRSTTAT